MNANWVLAIVIILWGLSLLIQDDRHGGYRCHVEDELDGLDDTIVAYQDRVQDLTHALQSASKLVDEQDLLIRSLSKELLEKL